MNFHSLANGSGGSTTYTNSGRIIPLKLLLKSCEFVVLLEGYGGIKTVFERGKINEIWKNIELEKWFDPAFQEFVDRELSHAIRK